MGQTTSKLGLYLPGGGSSGLITPDEAADIDKINDNMKKIDADAGVTVCTSSTRPASPYNGKIIYETDTKYVRVWNAATSNWDLVGGTTYPAANLTGSVAIANGGTGATTVAAAQDSLRVGLVPISPSGIFIASGTGSVTPLGRISFSNATKVEIGGVFSDSYRNYLVKARVYASVNGANLLGRMYRLGVGENASATYQVNGASQYSSTLMTYFGGSQTHFSFGEVGSSGATTIHFFSPWLNVATAGTFTTKGINTAPAHVFVTGGFQHDVSDYFDSFTLFPSGTATFGGDIQVFGYND